MRGNRMNEFEAMGMYLANHVCLNLDKQSVRFWRILRLFAIQN